MRSQSIRVTVFSIFLLASYATVVSATENPGQPTLTKKDAKALIVNAKTPEDHFRLASYFQNESKRQEVKAKYHDEMAQWYRDHPLPYESKMPSTQRMQYHCKYFADEARKAGATASGMAEEQEKAAKQLQTTGF